MDLPIIDPDKDMWPEIAEMLKRDGRSNMLGFAYLKWRNGRSIASILRWLQKDFINQRDMGYSRKRPIALSDKIRSTYVDRSQVNLARLKALCDRAALAPSELELIEMATAGYTDAEMADKYGVDRSTITYRRLKIIEKIRAAVHIDDDSRAS